MWKQTPQTETSKWIIHSKISFFPQSQSGAGNTSMPLGSPLAKQILTTCKIFSKKSIIYLVICSYCSGIKKKEKKKTVHKFWSTTQSLFWKRNQRMFFCCCFNSGPDGKKKTNVFYPKKGNTWKLSKILLPRVFFLFFFKQHGKSEVEMVNELWLGESLVSGEQRYFPSGTLLFWL